MGIDHAEDLETVTWDELKEELGFTPAERKEIARGAQRLIAASRARRAPNDAGAHVFHATARRAGEWWALEVSGLPGVFSQVKHFDDAEAAVREAIALMLGTEPEAVRVEIVREG